MRAELLGIPIDLLAMDETVARCIRLIEQARPAQHVAVNASKVLMARDTPAIREIIGRCALVSADGQSVVWAGRLLGVTVPERVTGIDLMERLLSAAASRGYPTYFLGAREDALSACMDNIRARYPELIVAGCRDGYFDDAKAVAVAVRDSGARLLFVGMPSPRKEFFLSEHLSEMGPVFAMGVGGSFDVIAGVARRAPMWMQRAGLEWLYRLLQEPGRMWRRYLVGNTRFTWLVLREVARRRLWRGRSDPA